MTEGFFEHAAADPRRRARWALAMIAVGFGILILFHNRIYNSIAGPFTVEARDLSNLDHVPFERFVQVVDNGEPVMRASLIDTGMQERTFGSYRIGSVASFKQLATGGDRLLVRVEETAAHGRLEGILREIDNDERSIDGGRVGARMILDCTKNRFWLWSLAAAGAGLGLIALGLDQLRRARKKPEVRPLRRFT